MATFKDACYQYKKLNKLNNAVLKLGANDVWRPSTLTKCKGWCLDCCQHTDLTYCQGCLIYHVCEWCSQYSRCFLDNDPHLLRMRTFRNEITKSDLENLINMYNTLFPINQKIVNKFANTIKQHKCRNEYLIQWYNHFLMPITLQSLSIELDGDVYYIFGYYDSMRDINQTPFSFTNLIDMYDKLLLDNVNFNRMSFLPVALQQEYALRYFSKSRFISEKRKCISDLHFSTNVIENLHNPSFKIQITRNCSELSSDWNKACNLIRNISNYFDILKSSHTESYNVSPRCRVFTQYKLKIASKLIKPNYVASNHNSLATEVHNCKWCSINNNSIVWTDFRIKNVYNDIFNFIRALVKSNLYVGHCSSEEKIYEYIKDVLDVCDDEKWKMAVTEIFNCLEPVELDTVKYVLFNHEVNWDVINLLVQSVGKVPQILTLNDIIIIMKSIIYEWFDIRYMRNTPMTTFTVYKLRQLCTGVKTVDYDSGISDVE
uniref:Non-structural protein 1 n=1 Tax=Human rotavirus A TaxID=10941 RepID=A0A858AXI7_9REOV|nr:non-structural protein 1 [Human rotavirus A]QHX60375.1 non-structural protein 1 [Human rotavirus A]